MYFYLYHYSRDVTSFSLKKKISAMTAAQHPPIFCVALKQCHLDSGLDQVEEISESSNLRLVKRVTESPERKVKQKVVNCECSGDGCTLSY